MKSMTGYGKAVYKDSLTELTVEIKTVNNRFLDINCKYPRGFAALEEIIRAEVKQSLARGRVDVYVNYSDCSQSESVLKADLALACAYVKAAEKIAAATGLCADALSISDVIRYPEVLQSGGDDDRAHLAEPLKNTLKEALERLDKMRAAEGEKLKADMLERLDGIETTLGEIKLRAPEVAKAYAEKLRLRMEELLKNVPVDEARLLNEVAAYSDKSNIDEELTRLNSHTVQFRKICNENNSGKKLDFLVQEFNREANTVCSKSNDLTVTKCGLKLKSDIEKIREQIQNIE